MDQNPRISSVCVVLTLCVVGSVLTSTAHAQFNFTVTADPRSSDAAYDQVCAAMNANVGGQGVFQVSPGDIDPLQPLRDKIDSRFGASALWYPGVGNHEAETSADMDWIRAEYDSGNGVRTPLKNFTNQDGPAGCVETTYTWDYANAHFIMLNEYWNGGTSPGSDVAASGDIVQELYDWLAADLAANTQPIVFVFGHEPAYPFNRHVGDSLDQYPANRDAFWNLLEAYDVQAYFVGHTHYYSKYQPTPESTWQVDVGNAGNEPEPAEGQTFANVIVGSDYVTYDIWRDASGSWAIADTWTVLVGLKIQLNNTQILRSQDVGDNLSDDTFTVTASGDGTINYTIIDDAAWLSCSPASGSSSGESDIITVSYNTSGLPTGQHSAVITVTSGDAVNSPQTIDVAVSVIDPAANLIANGDFANGLTGWTQWTERGSFTPVIDSGQLQIASTEHNGGMWQQFGTGGSGREINLSGWWASDPTLANYQWGEVLIINGPRTPVNGQDITGGGADEILIYKNDTWASTGGWSGQINQTAPVTNVGSFTSAGDVATLILKSGNMGGTNTGTRFDDVVVQGPAAQCSIPEDCDDGLFCNGAEDCVGGSCQAGTDPCPSQLCDEANDVCVDCLTHGDCDDGQYCNGAETCDGANTCQPGTAPNCDDGVNCTTDSCNEGTDSCDNVPDDAPCDNGLFCDGAEICDPVLDCQAGSDPCPGLSCDEAGDVCFDPSCNANGVCDAGEDCNNCPADCITGAGATCGNGVCEAGDGEDCVICPDDCNGKQGGKPSGRFCCGDGDGVTPLPCSDPVCSTAGWLCTDVPASPSCCGDATCEGIEDGYNCEIDCGPPSFCGDATCDSGEDECNCPDDCGTPPSTETNCTDGIDEDCDNDVDCDDSDCVDDPACLCGAKGDPCTDGADCCSGKCVRNACK